MRNFLRAIATAIAAMAVISTRWVKKAGEWVLETVKALPTGGGGGAVPAIEPELQVEATRQSDQQVANIRAVAAMMAEDRISDPQLTGRLSELEFRWVCACDREMLKSIVRADDKAVRDHIAQRKSIRGVLACDEAVITAYEKVFDATPSMQRAKVEVQQVLDDLEPVPAF